MPTMTAANDATPIERDCVYFNALSGSGVDLSTNSHEFDYQWKFGDTAETGNWATGRQSSKDTAFGIVAAHVYETAGTYTATLVLTKDDDTEIIYTELIVVSAFDPTNTYHYDATLGDDGNDGSKESPWKTIAKARTEDADNTRHLFKRGETFTFTARFQYGAGRVDVELGDYGTGALPIWSCTTDINAVGTALIAGGSRFRIYNIDFRGSGGSPNSTGPAITTRNSDNVTVLNCTCSDFKGIVFNPSGEDTAATYHAEVGCTFLSSSASYAHAHFGGSTIGLAIIGCNYGNTGSHIIRISGGTQVVVDNNNLIASGTGGDHILKINNSLDPSVYSRHYVVSRNHFITGSAWMVGIGPQNNVLDELIGDVLVEANLFRFTRSTETTALLMWCVDSMVRNNVFDCQLGALNDGQFAVVIDQRGGEPVPDNVRVYNNSVIFNSGGSPGYPYKYMLYVDGPKSGETVPTNITVRNNAGNWTNGSMTIGNGMIRASDMTAAETDTNIDSDFNIWFSDHGDDKFASNLEHGGRTIVQWQGDGTPHDENGLFSDSLFIDSANGDLKVGEDSPCYNAGFVTPYVRRDYDFKLRPTSGNITIGAFEVQLNGGGGIIGSGIGSFISGDSGE